MSEEEEIQKILNEYKGIGYTQAKKLLIQRKKLKGESNTKKIEVTVDTGHIEDLIRRLKISEDEKEDFKQKLELLATKEFNEQKRKCGAPNSIETPNELLEWVRTHKQAEREADPVGYNKKHNIGAGQATLSQQSGSGEHEFDSKEEMIDFLRRAERSRDSEEAKNAKLILDDLFKHSMQSMDKMGSVRTKYEHQGDKSPLAKIRKDFSEKRSKEIKERKKSRDD